MTTPRRLPPENRKANIFAAAMHVAITQGFLQLTRDATAIAANISPALVTRYFFTTTELRKLVMEEAIRQEILPIIAEGIAGRDQTALNAPQELRARALDFICKP